MEQVDMVGTTYTDCTIRVRMRCSFADNNERMLMSRDIIKKWLNNTNHWQVMLMPESHGPSSDMPFLCENTIIDSVDVIATRFIQEPVSMFNERMELEGEDIV
jgi:hypothetical protein